MTLDAVSVFAAVFTAEIAKMFFERYFKTPVEVRLEKVERRLGIK